MQNYGLSAGHTLRERKEIDIILKPLNKISEPFNIDRLLAILKAHWQLVKLIKPICRKTPRSFASKYPHFHCPPVPIYDSIANKSLKMHYRIKKTLFLGEGVDKEYREFIIRLWQLYRDAIKAGVEVKVKRLEQVLIVKQIKIA